MGLSDFWEKTKSAVKGNKVVSGAIAGAVAGTVVGGPVGTVVGAFTGGWVGGKWVEEDAHKSAKPAEFEPDRKE